MKKYLLIAILSLTAFLPITAQKFSVAYVDMQYILKNLPQYETANEQLNMISRRWQKDIDAAQNEVKVLTANYQTEQIFLSEDMQQRREEEILAKEQEVLELKRKYFGQE
jgi:outer membrane protein